MWVAKYYVILVKHKIFSIMSRIGKLPIALPEGVEIKVSNDNVVTVKGKLGELSQAVDPDLKVKVEEGQVIVERPSEEKRHKALHGLYRSLIANMVQGVSEGFKIVQELVGVGYKAQASGQVLELSIGYSHNVFFELPEEVKVETITERGKNPLITLTSHDKQLLGQVAAKIRSLRKPEPYKGKGIRFQGEEIRKKAGKAAAE
jgi:large subunit ribosomal protein L6